MNRWALLALALHFGSAIFSAKAQSCVGPGGTAVPCAYAGGGPISEASREVQSMHDALTKWAKTKDLPIVNVFAGIRASAVPLSPVDEARFREFVTKFYQGAQETPAIKRMEFLAPSGRPTAKSIADLYLECSAISPTQDETQYSCTLTSTWVSAEQNGQGNDHGETIHFGIWNHRRNSDTGGEEERNKEALIDIDLLRHGSDKIEIAWNLGRAVGAHSMGPSSLEEAKRNREEFESAETASTLMEECPGKLTKESIKKVMEATAYGMDQITIHLHQMRASTDFGDLTKTVSQLLSSNSSDVEKAESLDAFKAPRQIVDAYRAGFYSVALELYGIKSCAQQQWLKLPQCPALTTKLQGGVARLDGDWKGRMEAILSDYGLSLKLPPVDCSPASNEAFVQYVESVKRSAWKAMRTRFEQQRRASPAESSAKPVKEPRK
jgi:hypothetical protein